TLPVLNRRCVEAALKTAFALNCTISESCTFDRKHYFYADLPSGYQITQHLNPIATNGHIDFIVFDEFKPSDLYSKRVALTQVQLEQDSGKSLHDGANNRSLIDLNRCGVALMEFVFAPTIYTAVEAVSLVKELSLILKKIDCCTCKMEEGALRVDVNISVHKPGESLGTRCEIKNLNSFNSMQAAIKYEALRQINVLENGGTVVNETRAFNVRSQETVPMRDKEVVQDYRFMPEPNLPPVIIKKTVDKESETNPNIVVIDKVINQLPILPKEERERLSNEYGLSSKNCYKLVENDKLCNFFEHIMKEKPMRDANALSCFLLVELMISLRQCKTKFENAHISREAVGECFDLYYEKTITANTACNVLNLVIKGEKTRPMNIVDENGWRAVNDEQKKREICMKAIEVKKHYAERYKKKGQNYSLKQLTMFIKQYSNDAVDEEDAIRILDEILQPPKKN
ncbi:glutamyl-tRNA(Gln) amidotransferase subunit B-like protein, partial [Dinothrombium tinctorium]